MSYRGNEFTNKTKLAAWNRSGGICERCRRPIKPSRPEYHHIKLVAMGGDSSLDNCLVACVDCHQILDNEGMAPVLKSNAVRKKDLNLKTKKGRHMRRSEPHKSLYSEIKFKASSSDPGPPVAGGGPDRIVKPRVTHAGRGAYLFRSLRTERLLIRKITIHDNLHPIVDALNNKEHMRYSEQRHTQHSISSQKKYLQDLEMNGHLALGIYFPEDTQLPLGSVTCYVDTNNLLIDMGIMLNPWASGKGYGLEAWKRVMDWWLALDGPDFKKVEAGHNKQHFAMYSICKKSGMDWEGTRLNHFLNDDDTRSAVYLWGKS